jgi:ferric-dicitrate binding protein FerR (iron transport regulator)
MLIKNMEDRDPEVLLQKAQALANDIKKLEGIQTEAAFRRSMSRIKTNERRHRIAHWMRYAAFLTLPLMLSTLTLGYILWKGDDSPIEYAEVKVIQGSLVRYELPDHSVAWLNSGSTLRYPTRFAEKSREVELQGEAYFEVQADKKCPFYVNTPDGLKVYVYGTKFNISAYADDPYIETVLEKGRVSVITPTQDTIAISPSESLLYDKQTQALTHQQTDVYSKTAWKDGKLIFRDASLEEIFKRLERRFNVDISFSNRTKKEYKYRATFRGETLTQILNYLSRSANLRWQIEEQEQLVDGAFSRPHISVVLY